MSERETNGAAAPTVSVVPIDDLVEDPANLKHHGERNKEVLLASLKRFGAARSVVADGKNVIRAGNGTLEAARKAGIKEAVVIKTTGDQLVVVQRDDWTPTEGVAYSIGDNKTAITDVSYDDLRMAETLRALQSEDFDLGSIGFTDEEVDELCAVLGDGAIDKAPPEDFPEKDEDLEVDHECPKCGYRWS
jgi:hypothetical protein